MEQLKQDIINILVSKNDFITSKELAIILNVSSRTIKKYIKEINEENQMIFSNNKGYYINKNLNHLKYSNSNQLPQNYYERSVFIIKSLLLDKNNMINIYDLSEILYVSTSTIKNDIRQMNDEYHQFHVNFKIQRDYIKMISNERMIRKLVLQILSNESSEINHKTLKIRDFIDIDVDTIEYIIKKNIQNYNFFINDLIYTNVILQISLTIYRIMKNNALINDELKSIPIDYKELIDTICIELAQAYSININQSEKYEIYILLRAGIKSYTIIDNQEFEKYVPSQLMQFVKNLLNTLNSHFLLNLSNGDFINTFALHINNLIFRAKNNIFLKNPLSSKIRQQNPLIFDIAYFVSESVSSQYNIEIKEGELALIAYHIGGQIEIIENNEDKLNVALYIPKFNNNESLIYQKIYKFFQQDINILNFSYDLSFIDLSKIDFLISTVSVNIPNIDIFEISPFLSSIDKSNLQIYIENFKKKKRLISLCNDFDKFFSKELFHIEYEDISKYNLIHSMSQILLEKGYVNDDFFDKVIQRENNSSTDFGIIAIPHSLKMDANKTTVSVCLHKKGIFWGRNTVYIIILISINFHEREEFKKIYSPLVEIFANEANYSFLKNINNFEDFRKSLLLLIP